MAIIYFKIIHGYDSEQVTPLEPEELEKAYGLFLLGGRAIFKGGAVDSKYIQRIAPDFHRIMGWAQDWKLEAEDYNELADKGVDREAKLLQEKTQEKVQYLIANNKENLIGTGAVIPELDRPKESREGGMKRLGEI